MPKVVIDCDEEYPFYSIHKYSSGEAVSRYGVEIPAELLVEYDRVMDDLKQLQEKLKNYYKSPV